MTYGTYRKKLNIEKPRIYGKLEIHVHGTLHNIHIGRDLGFIIVGLALFSHTFNELN